MSREACAVHGIVLKHRAVGEYDWIVTLLTAERGRINAFGRGARRPGTKLSGNVEPFCFGTFHMAEGRSAYVLTDVRIDHYFEGLRTDLEKASYGTFFLELAEYYSGENLEAPDLLNLLYLTLKVLDQGHEALTSPLIRCVFEIRCLVHEGVFPGADAFSDIHKSAVQALSHIASSPLNRLYTFSLSDEALQALTEVTGSLRKRFVDRRLLSLEMLSMYESRL